uniref:2-C-methyl-D-erythritol 4-phosphate cytidylyltransferase, chloroplastic-like n=1 Tax=Fragaria vesca subsp. vesca TaxID=101020 RepID=UPI0005C8F953|nr:PREDICTED: 2-C-methyl-D-erythritol 4-phosphate cytidylyltransferase, chloroplastic-like [Fragaria vesca subsp. vesca]
MRNLFFFQLFKFLVILIWVMQKLESVIVKERSVSVILLANGKVSMLKQYLPLLSQPIALYSAVGHMYSDLVSVVFSDAKHKIQTELKFILSGKERQESVYSGLEQVRAHHCFVL